MSEQNLTKLISKYGLTEEEARSYLRQLAKTRKVKVGVCSDCGTVVVVCPKCGKPHHVDEVEGVGAANVRLWFKEDKGFVEIERRDFLKLTKKGAKL